VIDMGKLVLQVATVAALVALGLYFLGSIEGEDRPAAPPPARSADVLQKIANEPRPPAAPANGWTPAAVRRLRMLDAEVDAVEAMARAAEVAMSAQSSGCRFAKTHSDPIAAEIAPARLAMSRAFDALSAGAAKRAGQLAREDARLGWVGWRGSRWVEWEQLVVLGHDLAITKTRADLAFTRLRAIIATAREVRATCQ
jgi:hypothetical protein